MPNQNLVIVESPTKIKSISRYLGSDYTVVSSKGHIIDLPKSKLGIEVENNYKPLYAPVVGKKSTITDLKKAAKDSQKIYLATDLDREGEAIAWHIASALGGLDNHNRTKDPSRFQRVVFSEITKDAILEAFKNPRDLDYALIDAYQARRVLDRLVGYKLSPLLWKKIMYGLSAGRVQSIAVRLIVERENERKAFQSQTYYRVFSLLKAQNQPLEAELVEIDHNKIVTSHKIDLFAGSYKYALTTITGDKVTDLLQDLAKISELIVENVSEKSSSKHPSPPFATASLQRAGQTYLNLSAKNTMRIAQNLYEEGFISYHRTDSTNLSEQFIQSVRSYIKQQYGEKYVSASPNKYITKQKGAQEAHEAIRPTKVDDLTEQLSEIESKLGAKEAKLFELIWKRSVATQGANAEFNFSQIEFLSESKKYTFITKGTRILFDGYRKIIGESTEEKLVPSLKKGDILPVINFSKTEHASSPPPRYSEASLIRDLEAHGIGRPSTYAPTIDTIQARDYVYKDNGVLIPEDTGIVVNKLLVENFPQVVDLKFTAGMESQFDEIATGKLIWQKVIDAFYKPLEKEIARADIDLTRDDYKVLEYLDEKCPECQKNLIIKLGRYGKFYSCSNFPDCKYARPFIEEIGLGCFQCDGQVIVRRTGFGKKFFGCSNYPKCNWASWKDPRSPSYNEEEEKQKREARLKLKGKPKSKKKTSAKRKKTRARSKKSK